MLPNNNIHQQKDRENEADHTKDGKFISDMKLEEGTV
jgi:hypothetical protein